MKFKITHHSFRRISKCALTHCKQCCFVAERRNLSNLNKNNYNKIMANYHLTVKGISRNSGRSCVSSLAYRSASMLVDQRNRETYDYRDKENVECVEIVFQENAPSWIKEICKECAGENTDARQIALQKLSDIFEATEKRFDARVYREIEFSLPNELTKEQNKEWARQFVYDTCVAKGMVAILNFHFDMDKKTGEEKPHCHVLLSTRELNEAGFSPHKRRDWDRVELVEEWREQYAQYQNLALKEHGFEVRVDHRSSADQGLEIDPQPKRGKSLVEMTKRGLQSDKSALFDLVRLKNQFKIVKNPELVFSIVTAKHSTFTRQDIARVLNRYIEDADQFRILHDWLLGSPELIRLDKGDNTEPVYTTREMLRLEMSLVDAAEQLGAQDTHKVDPKVVDQVIANQNTKLAQYGGLSTDQVGAIRHMLSAPQISCVVGYAGAGKTTSLEAAKEAWEVSGYTVIGLAPTGKAARNIEDCGIRSMTLHRFLKQQDQGRERIGEKTVLVLDEAGMVDSRRFADLLSIVEKSGAKIIPMGDGNQLQAVEAGPAFRLLTDRIQPAVLETVVRQQEDWQREATRLFGSQQASKALTLYLERGAFKIVEEKRETKNTLDDYCLARQLSGRIWKEMIADYEQQHGKTSFENIDFEKLSQHQDYGLYTTWKDARHNAVGHIIRDFEVHKPDLQRRGIDTEVLGHLINVYGEKNAPALLTEIEEVLRQMSYTNLVDTRQSAKEALVEAWAKDRAAMPDQSHLMLAFTNKDAASLNESARHLMREQGVIKGQDYTYETHSITTDDFGKQTTTMQNRNFAEGDRLLFTVNNNGLGVKNGSLGTVVSLNKTKMVVALDGKDQVQISFAPKLYPYIDHGWATNIHKSQGVTVDHVKKLASFEEYRNLAYVGMSRHRHSIEIFGSSLDFWREEKVIDRLSRVQEKLSGLDYLNAEQIQELAKQDTETLWHQQKIQGGKDLWRAIKVTTQDILGQLNPQALDRQDKVLSFENSEERRSVEVLSYLQQEINTEKHPWLKEDYRQALMETAADNPLEALARWQKVTTALRLLKHLNKRLPWRLRSNLAIFLSQHIWTCLKLISRNKRRPNWR
jgi:Ti-type conjugative transfer relaxase TraA